MIAIRTAGTKVTPVSFQEWKVKFEAEIKAVKKKEESDRVKAMPPKERDQYKKNAAKLSDRQLFARGEMELGEDMWRMMFTLLMFQSIREWKD